MNKFIKDNLLNISWIIALISTAGSLYFSEILYFSPCVLCWYQRIAMYPLVIILAVGIIKKDKNIHYYVLPISIIGAVFAFYQNLLYYNFLAVNLAPCVSGISCTTRYLHLFGFMDIPLLSLISFLLITILLLVHKKNVQRI